MLAVGRGKEGKPSKAIVTESESKARPVLAAEGRSLSVPTRGVRNARGSQKRGQGKRRSGSQSRPAKKPDKGEGLGYAGEEELRITLTTSTTKRKRQCERRGSGIEVCHVLRRKARQEKEEFERGKVLTGGDVSREA